MSTSADLHPAELDDTALAFGEIYFSLKATPFRTESSKQTLMTQEQSEVSCVKVSLPPSATRPKTLRQSTYLLRKLRATSLHLSSHNTPPLYFQVPFLFVHFYR